MHYPIIYITHPNQTPVKVTCTSIALFWTPPQRDNGETITSYILRGRSVGGEYAELYRGGGCSFIAVDLFADFAYRYVLHYRYAYGWVF